MDDLYENPWMFKGEVLTSEKIKNAHGMIYLIEEISTGRLYIGQKKLWTKKIKTINKKKKRVKVESDWRNYYSSSNYINEKVAATGTSDFNRFVLMLVGSDGMLNYAEMKLQMDTRVLEFPNLFINGYIGGRISTTHYKQPMIFEQDEVMINRLYSHSYFGFNHATV